MNLLLVHRYTDCMDILVYWRPITLSLANLGFQVWTLKILKAHIICITQRDVQKLLAHTDSNREFISQTFKDFVGKKIWSEFNSSWVTWEVLKLHHFAEYNRILANIFQEIQNCELKYLRTISYFNLWIMSHIYRSLFWGSKKSFFEPTI